MQIGISIRTADSASDFCFCCYTLSLLLEYLLVSLFLQVKIMLNLTVGKSLATSLFSENLDE